MLGDGFFVGDGNVIIDVADDAMNFGQHRSGRAGGVDENCDAAIRQVAKWRVQHRHRGFAKGDRFDVAGEADDFEGTLPVVIAKTTPNRILARPKRLRHRFADDRDPGGVFASVVLGEIAPPQDRNAHSFKIT